MTATPVTIKQVQDVVRATKPGVRVLPVAGRTKSALSGVAGTGVLQLDLSALTGVTEYDPGDMTLTALAGTPVREIRSKLDEHGQHLPFDPPFVEAGATLGGAVATGASGALAWRHGGVRDFVIGVQLVDGRGALINGGGKVVKNAAGFDLPKLMVGSIGHLGVIVRLSLKVFPRPPATLTLEIPGSGLERAVATVSRLARGPVELEALEILPGGVVLLRLGGRAHLLETRASRVEGLLGCSLATRYRGADEARLWRQASEFSWLPPDAALVRVGLQIGQVVALDRALAAVAEGAETRYGIGGTVAWVAWPLAATMDALDTALRGLGLRGMVLAGPPGHRMLGTPNGGAFGARVARAMDPCSRFREL